MSTPAFYVIALAVFSLWKFKSGVTLDSLFDAGDDFGHIISAFAMATTLKIGEENSKTVPRF